MLKLIKGIIPLAPSRPRRYERRLAIYHARLPGGERHIDDRLPFDIAETGKLRGLSGALPGTRNGKSSFITTESLMC